MNNYKLIFMLSVGHSYYRNNICTNLRFVPAGSTTAILNRYGFKINYRADGFQLYAAPSSDAACLFKQIENATGLSSFRFEIKNGAAEFVNVTDWPLNWKGSYVFDNSDACNTAAEETVLLNQSLVNTNKIEGSITLHFKNLIEMLNRGVVSYSIRFKARLTQWQYYIVNRNNTHFSNLLVKGRTGMVFSGPEHVFIPTGEKALFFSSNETLLPLSEVTACVFDLVNSSFMYDADTPVAKTIYKGLPAPDPLAMNTVIVKGKMEASSPMYVYL